MGVAVTWVDEGAGEDKEGAERVNRPAVAEARRIGGAGVEVFGSGGGVYVTQRSPCRRALCERGSERLNSPRVRM